MTQGHAARCVTATIVALCAGPRLTEKRQAVFTAMSPTPCCQLGDQRGSPVVLLTLRPRWEMRIPALEVRTRLRVASGCRGDGCVIRMRVSRGERRLGLETGVTWNRRPRSHKIVPEN